MFLFVGNLLSDFWTIGPGVCQKRNGFGLVQCPSSVSYRVLHLEVLDQVEVNKHANGSQRGFHVGQLKVTKAEVQKMQGLSGRHCGDL